ncbi:hypothetical protein I7I48_06586 [Histoplasma ohiense]|nr:hypothetical protein I7I48_06586 [Histoplasma ohiense (nom. inval.)]
MCFNISSSLSCYPFLHDGDGSKRGLDARKLSMWFACAVLYIVICTTRSIQDAKQVVLYKMKDSMVLFLFLFLFLFFFSFWGEGFLLKSLFYIRAHLLNRRP